MSKSWWWKFIFVALLVVLATSSLVPSWVELMLYPEKDISDPEVDLARVSTLFEIVARPATPDTPPSEALTIAQADLERLADTINGEVGFYRGEGKLRVELLEDGSVLAWVDDDRNGRFTPAPPYDTQTLPQLAALDLNGAPQEGAETVFRAWLERQPGADGKPAAYTLVLKDREQRVFAQPLVKVPEGSRNVPLFQSMLAGHQAAYGAPWARPVSWSEPTRQASDSDSEEDIKKRRQAQLPGWYVWFSDSFTDRTLTLGLDLKGGLLMRYSVGLDEAINAKLRSFGSDVEKKVGRANVTAELEPLSHRVTLTFKDEDSKGRLAKILTDFNYIQKLGEDGLRVTLAPEEAYVTDLKDTVLKQAVETIRRRVDQFGLANPSVRVEGGHHIVVELPGLSKRRAREAERLISATAVLTFKRAVRQQDELAIFNELARREVPEGVQLVRSGEDVVMISAENIYASNGALVRPGKSALRAFALANADVLQKFSAAEKVELVFEEMQPAKGAKTAAGLPARPYWRMRAVYEDKIITGEHVDNAQSATNPDTNMPYVSLKLNSEGGERFGNFTKAKPGYMQHKLDKIAILMDDTLISDPVVNSEILGGNVSIEMGQGNRQKVLEDVNHLVRSLRSGALAAPIAQEFKTIVGPSLGADSIRSGGYALAIGLLLVVVFMVVYYRKSGLIANTALVLNIVFILAVMAMMGATMTLPGIAGIVLTVGMAVDANVIIFERVREELRNGEAARKAISLGYDRAYWSILDANITTGLAAVVMMEFGSGPVQGFAVTLLIGIITSVFTAIFVTRLLFDWWLTRFQVERLSV
jgi:protein-export membrane protein SecD